MFNDKESYEYGHRNQTYLISNIANLRQQAVAILL
jgi:hypothetical protein